MADLLLVLVGLGMLGMVVFFILILISFIRKKRKIPPTIGMIVCFVVVIATSLIYPDSDLDDYRARRQEKEILEGQEKELQEGFVDIEPGELSEESEYTINSNMETADEIPIEKFHENGERISIIQNGDICVMKYKIKPSWNNEMTVNQNFHTAFNFILDGNGSAFNEVQYWAVADMSDGSEQKVISFTVNKETIDAISSKRIVASDLAVHANDLWIHNGLQE